MAPSFADFRRVLGRNGFDLARQGGNHEIWVRKDEGGAVVNRVPVSHGNAEIRTKRLFRDMLRQSGKSEEHFYEVLRG